MTARKADPWNDLLVIDARAPRFNQVFVAGASLLALATGFWPLMAVMGLQLAVTVLLGRRYCLPCLVYFHLVQPRFGEGELEDSRAPRFANIVGAVFLTAASIAFALGAPVAGQVLGGIVAALATLGVATGICVGCESYRLLARLRGVRGKAIDRIDLADLGVTPESGLVVEFTHPLCADCQRLDARLANEGRRVVRIDVSKQKALARKYGVTLVPLAFSLDADGRVLAPVY